MDKTLPQICLFFLTELQSKLKTHGWSANANKGISPTMVITTQQYSYHESTQAIKIIERKLSVCGWKLKMERYLRGNTQDTVTHYYTWKISRT